MDTEIILSSLPQFWEGFWVTIRYVFASLLLGFFLAIFVALARISKNPLLSKPAQFFMFVFRGSPLLVQIYIIYYGLAQFEAVRESFAWFLLKEAWFCALVGFVLNTTAYTAEIIRGAILAVPRGEVEAAVSYGMGKYTAFKRVIFPNAFRKALPAYGNEVIFLLHGSAVASTVTVFDITGVAYQIYREYYSPYEAFITAAILYLIITNIIIFGFKKLENKMLAHLKR